MIDNIRNSVRKVMKQIAKDLNTVTRGKLHPHHVTIAGLLLHVLLAILIINGELVLAGLGLIVFGLLDTLDGELARQQNRVSSGGMVLDATTDRMKEAILYAAIAYFLTVNGTAWQVWIVVMALGGSFAVSYSKAKGETALQETTLTTQEKNRIFQDGLMRFEVRMTLLVIGLISSWLAPAVALIAALSWWTAFRRLSLILAQLDKARS